MFRCDQLTQRRILLVRFPSHARRSCSLFRFSRRVLQISSGVEHVDGLVPELVIALAAAWLICFLALSKGVQSLGKVRQRRRLVQKEKLQCVIPTRSLTSLPCSPMLC